MPVKAIAFCTWLILGAVDEEMGIEHGRVMVSGLGDYKIYCVRDVPPLITSFITSIAGPGPFSAKRSERPGLASSPQQSLMPSMMLQDFGSRSFLLVLRKSLKDQRGSEFRSRGEISPDVENTWREIELRAFAGMLRRALASQLGYDNRNERMQTGSLTVVLLGFTTSTLTQRKPFF